MSDWFIFAYLILGYWATGRTIFRNHVLIGTYSAIIIKKIILGAILGVILIPWAIIDLLFSTK